MKKYAVSVVLSPPIVNGLNLVNNHGLYDAENESDARGQAIVRAMARNPSHSVALTPSVLDITPETP